MSHVFLQFSMSFESVARALLLVIVSCRVCFRVVACVCVFLRYCCVLLCVSVCVLHSLPSIHCIGLSVSMLCLYSFVLNPTAGGSRETIMSSHCVL